MEQVTKEQIAFMMRELGIMNKEWTFDMYAQGLIDYRIELTRNQYCILTLDSDDFFDHKETGKNLMRKTGVISIVFAIHDRKDYTKMKVLQYVSEVAFDEMDYEFSLN